MTIADVQIVRKLVLSVAILIGVMMFAVTNSRYPVGATTHGAIAGSW